MRGMSGMSRPAEFKPRRKTSNPSRSSDVDVAAIISGAHEDPFRVLGLHEVEQRWIARTFIPGADRVSTTLLDGSAIGDLVQRDPAGFFEGEVKLSKREPIRYHAIRSNDEWSVVDSYVFGPVLGPLDDYYGAEGTHLRLYDRLGAHPIRHEGVDGVVFALWAPNARRVSVVGDLNAWDGRRHVMRKRIGSSLWG